MDYIIPVCNMKGDGFKERLDNVNKMIEFIPSDVNIIIVEQVINPKLKKYTDFIISKDRECKKIIVLYPVFCKGWLYNIGVRNAESSDLLLVEMDVSVRKGYFTNLKKYLKENKKIQWFFAWDKIKYLEKDGSFGEIVAPRVNYAEGGIVYCKKDFYWKIGGFSEFILDLGGMDNEFIRRCEFLTKSYPMFHQTIYHEWHPVHSLKVNDFKKSKRIKENRKIYFYVKDNTRKVMGFLSKIVDKLGDIKEPIVEKIDLNTLYD